MNVEDSNYERKSRESFNQLLKNCQRNIFICRFLLSRYTQIGFIISLNFPSLQLNSKTIVNAMTITKSHSTPFFPQKMSKTFSSLSILGLGSSNSHPAVKSQFLARIKGPLKRMTSTFFHTKSKRERTSSFGSNFEWDGPEDGFTSQYKEDRRIKVAHRPGKLSSLLSQ